MAIIQAGSTIETVRINELPVNETPLSLGDALPLYVASLNKTKQIPLSVLRSFLISGTEQQVQPQPVGNSIVVTAGDTQHNSKRFDIPSVAGQVFILRRGFVGTLDMGVDYNVLESGGFVLLGQDDIIQKGEKFELQLAVQVSNSTNSGSGTIINGELPVSSNIILNQANHLRRIIRLRPTANGLLVRLPKVEEYPDNEVLFIEQIINAPFESTLQTQAGQNIYFNGQSLQDLHLRQGESILLQRASSGWFVLWASPSMYDTGEISFGYKVRDNEIQCVGQELLRSMYPRLWKWVQTLANSLVDDATWLTATVTLGGKTVPFPYRSCFSSGNGTTTFRLPDLRDLSPRVLKTYTGTDPERFHNFPGGYQHDELLQHDHEIQVWGQKRGGGNDPDDQAAAKGQASGSGFGSAGTWVTEESEGGTETRMKNFGVIGKICL